MESLGKRLRVELAGLWAGSPVLTAAGLLMLILLAASVVGLLVDPREVTGLNPWAKPLKFALSTILYSVTLAWMIGQLTRFRRVAWGIGTVSAVALAVELIIITGFAAIGETSHFNTTTTLHLISWSIMGTSISVLWAMAFVLAFVLFRNPLGDRARTLAIRAGVLIAILGMGLAFLMTTPTGEQLDDFQGIAGAHTVGLADGGPGLPILGWSTVAGDLRVPHFIGMHALQVLPLVAIALELLARRVPLLAAEAVRMRLIAIASVAYLGVVAMVTVQALSGESIVRPGAAVVVTTAVLAAGVLAAGVVAVRRR
jgi:hypothetical protein